MSVAGADASTSAEVTLAAADGPSQPLRQRDLQKLCFKLACRTSELAATKTIHLPEVLATMVNAADDAAHESAAFSQQVCQLWAADGEKGNRAQRKAALSDFIKQLKDLGAAALLQDGTWIDRDMTDVHFVTVKDLCPSIALLVGNTHSAGT